MKRIVLTQGKYALVDDEDFERLNQWKWRIKNGIYSFYARRHSPMLNGKRHEIKMHHEIIGFPPKGLETDHENGSGLDNQRHNLRHVTTRQNQQNQKNRKTSRYPGVSWYKQTKKWKAQIQINGLVKSIGYFRNEFDAFLAYKQAVEAIGEEVIGEIN